jgi:hypothetical protein
MTASLRRGGSAVAFTWNKGADPTDAKFSEALSAHRFRSIERAASEEVSVGWVTPADPTGDSFDANDMDAGGHWWLRFRRDVKKFPAARLQMEIANAERTRGKKLSARERRELKDHLHEQLLPGILPRTQFFDVLVSKDLGTALLLSTSKAAREAFAQLAKDSFGITVERLTSGAHRSLKVDKLTPTVFPGRGPKQLELPGAGEYLGCELLLWLWWKWETDGGEFSIPSGIVGIAIDDRVEFEAGDDETSMVLRHGLTTQSAEARTALRNGRVPTKARLLVAKGQLQWTVTLDGASLAMGSVGLPEDSDDCETPEDVTADRAENWLGLHTIVEHLFDKFMGDRVSMAWAAKAREIAEWMAS